jgi:ElaB/YqjD/DUF883 family membrane-anchored ribosome-binding protein
MKNRYAKIAALLVLLSVASLCQDYPFLRKVEARCVARSDLSLGMYYYSYTLQNDETNPGWIEVLEIDISRNYSSTSYDTVGLRFYSNYGERSFRTNYPKLAGYIVPVGFPSLPPRWGSTWGNKWTAHLSNLRNPVKPSQTISGLVMMSRGLPGLRRMIVKPDFQDDLLFPSIEDTVFWKVPATRFIDSIRAAVNFYGWTIGPIAPPLDFSASIWIDTLLSYTRQSAHLGWLGRERDDDCDDDERPDDGIVKNIEQRLQKAKRELMKGDSVQARKELEKLVQKVERIWKRSQEEEKKHKRDRWERKDNVIMTTEAYALLKYNTEYLADRLPREKKKKH